MATGGVLVVRRRDGRAVSDRRRLFCFGGIRADRSSNCRYFTTSELLSRPWGVFARANHLSIENGGALKPRCLRCNEWIAVRPIGAIHRVEAYPSIPNVDLQPIAVVL